ncbi:MAG TPA: copper chaperone PCu(A)C [Burkholderiales bacterium]|nr:copper chaperone PCu(A)C [Burkholderiales bacterium]
MRKMVTATILLATALLASVAHAQITVQDAWMRATPPGAKIAAGYLTIRNAGSADRLVGATSPAAERVETHVTARDGDMMRMREVKGYDVPAKGTLELKPAGAHLMLVNIKAPLKEGTSVPVTLRFQHAGDIKVAFQVRPLAGGEHHAH